MNLGARVGTSLGSWKTSERETKRSRLCPALLQFQVLEELRLYHNPQLGDLGAQVPDLGGKHGDLWEYYCRCLCDGSILPVMIVERCIFLMLKLNQIFVYDLCHFQFLCLPCHHFAHLSYLARHVHQCLSFGWLNHFRHRTLLLAFSPKKQLKPI